MHQIKEKPSKHILPAGFKLRLLETAEFDKHWMKPGLKIFERVSMFYDSKLVDSKKHRESFKKLRDRFNAQNHIRINIAVFDNLDRIAAWSWGYQETPTTFYMCNSAVLPQHRRKGLYTAMLSEMMNQVKPYGFYQIYSRHIMTNNDILIAKLKYGFKITNFELSERFGTMVHLSYFPNKVRNEILDFRSGLKRPNAKIKKYFKI